jgi:hypothetical protein
MQTPDRSSAGAALGQGVIGQTATADEETDPVDRIDGDQRPAGLGEAPAVSGDLEVVALAKALKDVADRRMPAGAEKTAPTEINGTVINRMAIALANVVRAGETSAANAIRAGRAIGTLNAGRFGYPYGEGIRRLQGPGYATLALFARLG